MPQSQIKTVKKASIFREGDFIYCKHYDTVIFSHNTENGETEIMKDLSQTSNRQIKYLVEGLNIDESKIQNVSPFEKWHFKGDRN